MTSAGQRDFFDEVYDVKSVDEQFCLYSDWATTYDRDVIANGYMTPDRCAEALRKVLTNKDTPILDVGCGTGYSGLALKKAGFANLVGTDINPDMAAIAVRRNVYSNVLPSTIDEPIPPDTGQFEVISAIEVIGSGAAPLSLLETIIVALPKGGYALLSFNEHTLADLQYEARVERYLSSRECELIHRDYGDHMLKLKLRSMVYILQKC